MDVVAVIVVDYENATVATAGRNEEATGEIGGYLTSDELAIDIETVSADRGGFADGIDRETVGSGGCVVERLVRRGLTGHHLLDRPQVRPLLV